MAMTQLRVVHARHEVRDINMTGECPTVNPWVKRSKRSGDCPLEGQADVRMTRIRQSPGHCKKLTLPTANGVVPNSANGVR